MKKTVMILIVAFSLSGRVQAMDYPYAQRSSTDQIVVALLQLPFMLMDTNQPQFSTYWFSSWRSSFWYSRRSIRRFFTYTIPFIPPAPPTPESYVKDRIGREVESEILKHLVDQFGLSLDQALKVALQNSPVDRAGALVSAAVRMTPTQSLPQITAVALNQVAEDQYEQVIAAALSTSSDQSRVISMAQGFMANAPAGSSVEIANSIMQTRVAQRNQQIVAQALINASKAAERPQVVASMLPFLPSSLAREQVLALIQGAQSGEYMNIAQTLLQRVDPGDLQFTVKALLANVPEAQMVGLLKTIASTVSPEQLAAATPAILAAIPAESRQSVLEQAGVKAEYKVSDDCCYIDPEYQMVTNAILNGRYAEQMAKGEPLYLPGDWANMVVAVLGKERGMEWVNRIMAYTGMEGDAEDIVNEDSVRAYALPPPQDTKVVLVNVSTQQVAFVQPIEAQPPQPVSPE